MHIPAPLVLTVLIASTGIGRWSCVDGEGQKYAMNEHLELYKWVRSGAAIFTAGISLVTAEPSIPGEELVTVDFKVDEFLWGTGTQAAPRFTVALPVSDIARLKFPDPIWGRVRLREGVRVLLVTPGEQGGASPLYAEEIPNNRDQGIDSIRAVLHYERYALDEKGRVAEYLHWLAQDRPVEKLFAAESLAKDRLSPVDPEGHVAAAFVQAFGAERDVFIRLNLGIWTWDNIYPKTNASGRVAILNCGIRSAADASEDIARLSLNHLLQLDSAEFRQTGVASTPGIIQLLESRFQREPSGEVRKRIQGIIEALRR